ncbi:MAG: TOMM precursor leader peptide-binding protein [Dehalococcoidia bacterium]|nr:TOMM precursor leader peptide-binding protein [Dehalococcoidia bacterium]
MIIFAEGSFGELVAETLRRRVAARVFSLVQSGGKLDELLGGEDFVAVALWRPYTNDCDELDAACFRHMVPWSAAVLSERYLYCGPLIVPGPGPCFHCYRRRFLTHLPAPERELALERAYASDPGLGSEGFAPASAGMAAAALLMDARAGDDVAEPGRLRRIDLLSGELVDTRVIRVHGCPRCGRHPGGGSSNSQERGDRFVRHLQPTLEAMTL